MGGHAYLVSSRPPTSRQRRLARAVAAGLLATFVVTVVLRNVQLARIDAFVPIANTVVCLNALITATLLYAQFAVTGQRGLRALAGGYLFTALAFIPHQLTFPGAFAPNGLLGGNLHTTPWLFLVSQYGILVGAILYAIDAPREPVSPPHSRRIAASIAGNIGLVVASVLAITWFATVHADLLPPIMRDAVYARAPFHSFLSPLAIASTLPLIVVFRRRRASILDLWLRVALVSWALEMLLTAVVAARFSLVWYVARTMGMTCSSIVLMAILTESMMLSSRLALSMAARDHEREEKRTAFDVMIGSIAHELRQPLTAIAANGEAGARLLALDPAGRRDVRDILDDIRASALRAGEILESVRSMISPSTSGRQSTDANDVVHEAVQLVRMDLDARGATVHLDLATNLPPIQAHRGQLIQVLVNGVTNAVDSLAQVSDRPRLLEIRTVPRPNGGVSILIEDSGAGFDAGIGDRVFDPFYSTKATGMGLGLSVCQSIVNAHGGKLSLTARSGPGAILRIDLPAGRADTPLHPRDSVRPVSSR